MGRRRLVSLAVALLVATAASVIVAEHDDGSVRPGVPVTVTHATTPRGG